jgi:NAD(P)-dependent dehydrogenase (short-subunit alcohol dehydrogenase family)
MFETLRSRATSATVKNLPVTPGIPVEPSVISFMSAGSIQGLCAGRRGSWEAPITARQDHLEQGPRRLVAPGQAVVVHRHPDEVSPFGNGDGKRGVVDVDHGDRRYASFERGSGKTVIREDDIGGRPGVQQLLHGKGRVGVQQLAPVRGASHAADIPDLEVLSFALGDVFVFSQVDDLAAGPAVGLDYVDVMLQQPGWMTCGHQQPVSAPGRLQKAPGRGEDSLDRSSRVDSVEFVGSPQIVRASHQGGQVIEDLLRRIVVEPAESETVVGAALDYRVNLRDHVAARMRSVGAGDPGGHECFFRSLNQLVHFMEDRAMNTDRFSLDGKITLVTGASRGIGRAIATGFAAAGADVAVAARNVEDLKKLAVEIEALGRRSLVVQTDVTDRAQIENMVGETIAEFGHLDTVVNNAGGSRFSSPLLELRPEGWDKTLRLNLDSVFHATQVAARHMAGRGRGSIIQIASVAGISGAERLSFYSAAKGGVRLFTQAVARELATSGVRVNTIAPGWIATDLNAALREKAATNERIVKSIPMRRWGKADEVVGAAIYLASDASSFVTGATLVIDGGEIA